MEDDRVLWMSICEDDRERGKNDESVLDNFIISMRFFIWTILLLLPLTTSAYSLITKKVDGHMVRIFHIPRTDDTHVTAVASERGTTLWALIDRVWWYAGINGAYFSPKDYTGLPDATTTIRIMDGDGEKYSNYFPDTGINGIFGFLPDGTPLLVAYNIYWEKTLRDNYNSGRILELQSGIANFPILLASGVNLVPRYDAVGLITAKMKVKGTKSFICRTATDDVKMGTIGSISMLDMPRFIQRFGCIDAINLDNGGSLAMYDERKYIVGPGRNIMDSFVIVKK